MNTLLNCLLLENHWLQLQTLLEWIKQLANIHLLIVSYDVVSFAVIDTKYTLALPCNLLSLSKICSHILNRIETGSTNLWLTAPLLAETS